MNHWMVKMVKNNCLEKDISYLSKPVKLIQSVGDN